MRSAALSITMQSVSFANAFSKVTTAVSNIKRMGFAICSRHTGMYSIYKRSIMREEGKPQIHSPTVLVIMTALQW